MATKQFYATGGFRYQTRMIRAGEPVQMDGPTARLYKALDKISDQKPRVVRAPAQPPAPDAPPKPKRVRAKRKAPARKKPA